MSAKANFFKIGLFVIAACILIVGGVVILGAGALFENKLLLETVFDGSVQGLDIGSPVKFRGVQIGKVEEIAVAARVYRTNHSYILVRMSLNSNAWNYSEQDTEQFLDQERVRGLRVRLSTMGLTGAAYVEADYLDPARNPSLSLDFKPEYPYMASAPSVITQLSESLTRIMTSLEDINVQAITSRLEKTLDAMTATLEGADISAVSAQAQHLLAELRETNTHLNKLIVGTQPLMSEAVAAAAGARKILEKSDKPIAKFMGSLQSAVEEVDRVAEKWNAFSGDLPPLAARLQTTLNRLDHLVSIPQQELEETMMNIRLISENLKDLTENSKKYPSQLFFGEPPNRTSPGGLQ
ncbi:MAG: MlaD family protein [Pseudomonadota bacterium]